MKALGTLLFHPHGRLKSFLWGWGGGLTRQMEADGSAWFTWTTDGVGTRESGSNKNPEQRLALAFSQQQSWHLPDLTFRLKL